MKEQRRAAGHQRQLAAGAQLECTVGKNWVVLGSGQGGDKGEWYTTQNGQPVAAAAGKNDDRPAAA